MTKLRIVHSLTQWTENKETYLRMFGRSADNELHYVDLKGFLPRIYVTEEEYRQNKQIIDFDSRIVEVESGHKTIYREPAVALKVRYSKDIPDVADMFESPYESDVWYNDVTRLKLGIETGIEVPEGALGDEVHYSEIEPVEFRDPDYRVSTIDIETDDTGKFPNHENPKQRILSVVVHDSYSDQYFGFIDLDGRTVEDCFPDAVETGDAPGCLDSLSCHRNEREMLIAAASAIGKIDPDILTAWSWDGFDYPYLIARMEEVGVNTSRLSRIRGGHVSPSYKGGKPMVSGRTIYNMLQAYKTTKFSELPSYKLDDVAEDELGEKKIQFEGGFFELYRDDPETFIEYNARDVRLCVDIDREADVLGFKEGLQSSEGCRFETTMNSGFFAQFAVRRRLARQGLIGPSAGMNDEEARDYEGAVVLDPFDGLAENVVALDLASLYPNNLAMFNMSPETVIDPDVAEAEDIPFVRAPSGVCFRTDREGVIAGMVDEMLELKNDLKQKLKTLTEGTKEHKTTEERYNVTKTVVNSLYGIIGWTAFFMYDPDVAESCTLAGQKCIKHTRDWLDSRQGVSVIYGDTDSTYIQLSPDLTPQECMDRALNLEHELNEVVYPELAEEFGVESRWEIEAEMYASRYFQCGSKKNYAYLLSGTFGESGPELLSEPKAKIKGFQCVKSNFAEHTRTTQRDLIESALHDESVESITGTIVDAVRYVRDGPDWDVIGMPQGLGKNLHKHKSGRDAYYSFTNGTPKSAHPRGAYFANNLCGTHYDNGSKPKRVYLDEGRSIDNIDVIAFEDYIDISNIHDEITMDIDKMIDRTVIRPNRSICDALGVDIDCAMSGQIQTGLGGFC